ncbi:hypothetical protein M1293_01395 [Candidatus Parvarchaeota archaeon]|nr:hypothetical protein [Candidatus Parvarchaeota archaeon]
MRTTKYGVGVRKRLDEVYKSETKRYKCPRCKKVSLSRQASGIWECSACRLRMADYAYKVSVSSLS